MAQIATSLTSPELVFAANTAILKAQRAIAQVSKFATDFTPDAAQFGSTMMVQFFDDGEASEYDDEVITTVNGMSMYPIQWNVDSLDWKGIGAQEIYNRVTGNVVPGSIVLFHNAAEHTPEALADIIEYLLAEGYEIVPVSELLLTGGYTIDHTGMMCSA